MADHIVSTKRVEEIILQEIPEGFFPGVGLQDLSTYINLLLRGYNQVQYRKDLAQTYQVRHYTRHLSQIEEVLANNNRIPGFNLNNEEKITLRQFIMKRLYGDTITIGDVSDALDADRRSSDEILGMLIEYDKHKLALEHDLFGKTLDEYMSFVDEAVEQYGDSADKDVSTQGIWRVELSDAKIRDLVHTIWKNHGREIMRNMQERLSILADLGTVAKLATNLDRSALRKVIKSYYTAIESYRLHKVPESFRLLERMANRE